MMSHSARRAVSSAVALGALVGLPVALSAPAEAAGPNVVLVGHGWGHGRGMGQWGAYGYAVDRGWTASMILDRFYGGTKAGSIGAATIAVRLASLDATPGTWITSSKDFQVGTKTVPANSAARILRTPTGWAVDTSPLGCAATAGVGTPVPVAQPLVRLVPKAGTTAADTLVTCANQRGYRGTLTVVQDGTALRVVNTLPVEEYLRSVVPSESPASWGDARGGWGIEALKAQAVAARSYAWSENRYGYAKTCDTTSCQVYGGATYKGVAVTDARTDRAIAATAGVVRVGSTGAVARTEFSSSTGGYTTGTAFTRVSDEGDRWSPLHTWTTTLDGSSIASRYGVGTFVQLRVSKQDGLGPAGGRALEVQIIGSSSTKTVTAEAFRAAFGLRSDWFFPAVQPRQQATSLRYVKTAFSSTIYRQYGYGTWLDHAPVSATDYAAAGKPPVTVIAAQNVKYPWSTSQYVVTAWPKEPLAETATLGWDGWKSAGFPSPRTVGLVYGTMFYRVGADKTIYAGTPDGSVHPMSHAEWAAAGYPWPVFR